MMGKLSEYAVAQRCEGFDDYFAKRSEYLREGTKRNAVRAKTPAISAFIRKHAEEECDSEEKDDKKKDDKKDKKKGDKKDKKMPPWMKEDDSEESEEKEAKAKSSTGKRFKKLVEGIKKNDMKDGKKDVDNPFAVAASFTANQKKKAAAPKYPHLAHMLEKTALDTSHVGPSAEAGALSGGLLGGVGGALGGALLGGLGGYGYGQDTQDFWDDDARPYGTAALGALLGGVGGGLGGAAMGAGSGALSGAGEGLVRNLLEAKYGPMEGHVIPQALSGAAGQAGLGAAMGGLGGMVGGAPMGPIGALGMGGLGALSGGLQGATGGAVGGAIRGATRKVRNK
jgi:hypothetical protein